MSFNSRESSLADGQPVRLYQFSRGAIRWSYNSSDRDITYQNQIFRTVPGGITDNGIICSGDPQSDQFVITAPADLDVALLYKTRSPSGAIDWSSTTCTTATPRQRFPGWARLAMWTGRPWTAAA